MKNLRHYFPLAVILLVGFFGVGFFSYNQAVQLFVVVGVGVFYVFWGLVHHKIKGDLYVLVFFEYLTVALLGVFIAISLLFR